MRGPQYVAILLVISLFLFIFGLGGMALTDPDETFYAQTAREMLEAGEWGTPLIFGEPQFEKPVLYYTLVRLSFMAFGVNEFAARFPSAVFGILGILAVYFLGRLLFSPVCGFLSGLVMATSVGYLVLSRACVTDIVLTVFILYGFLFFLLGWTGRGKVWYFVSSASIALAVLTKGPIGAFIPLVTIAIYFSISRQWTGIKKIPLGTSILIFLIIAFPWYIAMVREHGSALINEFFGVHNVVRFLEPEHRHGTSPLFYIPVVFGGIFPWTFVLSFGAWYMYRYDDFTSKVKGHRMFLLVWFLTVFVFFSVARTKLVTYILPLFPVLAIVTGRFWEVFLDGTKEDTRTGRYMNISYSLLAYLSIPVLAVSYFLIRNRYPETALGIVICGSIFVMGIFLSMAFLRRNKKALAFYSVVVTVMVLFVPLILTVLPGIEESSKVLSLKFKELSKPGEPIGGEDDHRRGVAFYTDRADVVNVHPYPRLMDFVERDERVWCIIKQKHYKQLKGHKPGAVAEPLARSGKKVLVTNRGKYGR